MRLRRLHCLRRLLRSFAPIAAAAALALPASGQGLELSNGGSIRIEAFHVDATVEEGVARVVVDETFRNGSDRVEEGVYRFKLPEDAVIGAFSMWMEGREKQGRVLEATQARATYDSIVRKRRDPGLLEQVGWREFRVNVFPIPARDTVRIKLAYAHVLRDDLGLQTLEVPLPEHCGAVGELRVRAAVAASRGLSGVDCPSHLGAVRTRGSDGTFELRFAAEGVVPTGPFVVRSILSRDGFDVALLAHREEGARSGFFVASVVPRLAAPPGIGRDVVFVIDCSGSMQGVKIEQARAALLAGLATLDAGDRFDVISFATDVVSLGGSALLAATPENLERGRKAAQDLSASGGTRLHDALLAALERGAAEPQRLFAIVLLSDGAPTVGETDPERILASWRERCGGARLFAFGVGADVRDFLLTKLAREGRGDARYVREGADLEVPLAALFDRLRSPLLLDPVVEIEGEGVRVVEREPRRLPDVFQGRMLLVTGRYEGEGRASMSVRGRSGANDVVVEVPVEFPRSTPSRPHVAQIWAKARVERLLDDLRALGPNAELRAEVLRLGLEHGLVTPFTSFLVVEDDVRVADGGTADSSRPRAPEEPEQDGATRDVPVGADAADFMLRDAPEALRRPVELVESFEGSGSADAVFSVMGANDVIGVDDASASDVIGVGGGAGGFGSGRYGRRGSAKAGGLASQKAVDHSLAWLKQHQDPAGFWDADGFQSRCKLNRCEGVGDATGDIVCTSLSLLAFLGAGNTMTTGRYKSTVASGLRYLQSVQEPDTGAIGHRESRGFLLGHSLATVALTEAYYLSHTPLLQRPAQKALGFLSSELATGGGWSSAEIEADDDVLCGWSVLALLAGKDAGLSVDDAAIQAGIAFLDARSSPENPRACAISVLLHVLDGDDVERSESVRRAIELVAPRPPPSGSPAAIDDHYEFFGAYATFQVGGKHWDDWSRAMQAAVLDRQRAAGDETGSWDPPPDGAGSPGGRIAATALNTLCLEVYYRYDKVLVGR